MSKNKKKTLSECGKQGRQKKNLKREKPDIPNE